MNGLCFSHLQALAMDRLCHPGPVFLSTHQQGECFLFSFARSPLQSKEIQRKKKKKKNEQHNENSIRWFIVTFTRAVLSGFKI